MEPRTSAGSQKRRRRFAVLALGVLSAFGIFSAIGTNLVNELFPGAWEWIAGTDSLRVNVADAPGAEDTLALATWSSRGLGSQLRAVDSCQSLRSAAEAAGAVRVGSSYKNLVVEGGTAHDVTIVDLRAEVLDRKPPMHGAEIRCESAGGVGGIDISFDLDELQPVARDVSEGADGMPYFRNGDVIVLKQG